MHLQNSNLVNSKIKKGYWKIFIEKTYSDKSMAHGQIVSFTNRSEELPRETYLHEEIFEILAYNWDDALRNNDLLIK